MREGILVLDLNHTQGEFSVCRLECLGRFSCMACDLTVPGSVPDPSGRNTAFSSRQSSWLGMAVPRLCCSVTMY